MTFVKSLLNVRKAQGITPGCISNHHNEVSANVLPMRATCQASPQTLMESTTSEPEVRIPYSLFFLQLFRNLNFPFTQNLNKFKFIPNNFQYIKVKGIHCCESCSLAGKSFYLAENKILISKTVVMFQTGFLEQEGGALWC